MGASRKKKSFSEHELHQARSEDIHSILQSNGIMPDRKSHYYPCPFHHDTRRPNMSVKNNVAHCFRCEKTADSIEVLMQIRGLSFVDAVKLLLSKGTPEDGAKSFLSTQPLSLPSEPIEFEVSKVQPLQNRALIDYVESRRIPREIARIYIQEVYYRIKGTETKHFFGVGTQNLSGGYSIRNKYGKYDFGKKDASYLPKQINQTSSVLSVFEGMFDMLSYCALNLGHQNDMLCMNSVTTREKALEFIQSKDYQKIELWLDQDRAGDDATEYFKVLGTMAVDMRDHFKGNDLNEFLVNEINKM